MNFIKVDENKGKEAISNLGKNVYEFHDAIFEKGNKNFPYGYNLRLEKQYNTFKESYELLHEFNSAEFIKYNDRYFVIFN